MELEEWPELPNARVGGAHASGLRQSKARFALHPVTGAVLVGLVVLLAVAGLVRLFNSNAGTAGNAGAGAEEPPAVAKSDLPELGAGLVGDRGLVSASDEDALVIFVTGQVAASGVVEVPPGSRVEAAVEAAGGLGPEADPLAVNLARPLVDGEHVHVPAVGEEPRAPDPSSASGPAPAGTPGGCVSLNQATPDQLETLDGVGPKIAERIVAHRDARGPFTSNEGLLSVSGIGPKLMARISEGLCSSP